MVDLWSADGHGSRNVVMHPSSQQGGRVSPRFSTAELVDIPSVPGPSSRPNTATSGYGGSSSWVGGSWRTATCV